MLMRLAALFDDLTTIYGSSTIDSMSDAQEIATLHTQRFQELADKYGSMFDIPKDELAVAHEMTRARHVLLIHPEGGATALKQYGVAASIIAELTDEDATIERRTRRADKYKTMLDWCKTNVAVQVTPDEMAEIGDVSRATALKFIQDRVDLFRKVKRGLYEVRDPDTERAVEK